MIINLSDDWADYDTGEVSGAQLGERIDELDDLRAEYEEEGGALPAEEAEELRVLLAFRAEVTRLVGDFDEATIVPDDDFEKHIQYWAEEEYGIGPDNLGDWVNWRGYADNQKGHLWTEVKLDGQAVWVK